MHGNGEEHDDAASPQPRRHVRVCVPEPVCQACLTPWPCDTARPYGATARASEFGWTSGSGGTDHDDAR